MAPSTPRLSEYARCFVYPPGITKTVWPRVEAKGRELGLGFDWWQAQAGTVILGYGVDGKYVATVGGIGMSIPRQVGKTYFVLALIVIMCILFPGLQVVWTAHHLRTSTKTFKTLQGIARRKKVAPHIKSIRVANGEQEVEFVNGSTIMFGARSQGFGRGFDEIDIEVFDEGQILDTKALEDMVAATNQARHIHGALLIYMGTPPRPTDPSAAFSERRAEALRGEAEGAIWLEIAADPDSDPNDQRQYPLMNPSFPTRTPIESLLRLRKNLKDDDSWNREGRGIWLDASGLGVFAPGAWASAFSPEAPTTPISLGIAASLDQAWLSLGAVSLDHHLAPVLRMRSGDRAEFVAQVARICSEHGLAAAIDRKGPASFLIADLLEAGCRLIETGLDDLAQASANLRDAVEGKTVSHGNYPDLNEAVDRATWRTAGDRRVFGRKGGDISMLEAVALALEASTQLAPTIW